MANAPHPLSFKAKEQGVYGLSKKNSSRPLSCMASNQGSSENVDPIAKSMRFNRVKCLVWVLHESARSFSHSVESLELSGTGPALAMAWVGKDVHQWHKLIAYKVYIYSFILLNY